MFAINALLPLIAKLIVWVACALVESVTMISGEYAPCPPTKALLISPVDALKIIPSGRGG